MIYKDFQNIRLSCLGMGNMRLPTVGNVPEGAVDYEKAQEIIDYAMTHGINYYDTSYIYHNGESEVFLGKTLSKYPRDSYYLATKFYIEANPDYKAVFEEQLARLQTDHIDFYLLHGMFDHIADSYFNCGCMEYFMEQQKAGRITYLGFSSHGSPETLERVASYHKWDFAQIQINYLDWIFSTSKREYEILTDRNIPIMVMEPIRGGRLAVLTEELNAKLKEAHPEWTTASWALRWLKRRPNVQVILSGMSALEQIKDNVSAFTTDDALSEEQAAFLEEIGKEFKTGFTIPCTSCRYCCPECPKEIDIPLLLNIYNEYEYIGWWTGGELADVPTKKRPSACIACGACQNHCPQSIVIPEIMKEFAVLEMKGATT